jgi:hydrogenase maturation protein HypF
MRTIHLPFKVRKPILATGADTKGAFAVAKADKAFLFEGFGDLSDLSHLARFEEAVRNSEKLLGIRPRVIACDHHPGYYSTRFAEMYGLEHFIVDLCDIQHHEAHVASAMTENGIKADVIGVAFDGTGFGWDGCTWGGEFFVGNPKKFRRAAHFEYVPMPGGEAAIDEPWRMAAMHLYGSLGESFLDLDIDFTRMLDRRAWRIVRRMIERGVNTPLTSSVGRLFDAAASIILCKMKADFEAELPIELEKVAWKDRFDHYDFNIRTEGDRLLIGYKHLFEGIAKDMSKSLHRGTVAAKFHNTIAEIVAEVASRLRHTARVDKVVLTGGVFQNKYLTTRTVNLLQKKSFKVFTHSKVSAGDPGIPLGQIAIARTRCV